MPIQPVFQFESSSRYQKANMLVFRKLRMQEKWKIRMHDFESKSG
jgi:hypothetical protein